MKTINEVRDFVMKNGGVYFTQTRAVGYHLFVICKKGLGFPKEPSEVQWIEIDGPMYPGDLDAPFFVKSHDEFKLYTGERLAELLKRDFL